MADGQIKDFDVTVKIRNNQLVERREAQCLSCRELASAIGISVTSYYRYESMRQYPFQKNGDLCPTAEKICKFYNLIPEILWPKDVLQIEENRGSKKLSREDALSLVGTHTTRLALPPDIKSDLRSAIKHCLMTLTPREEKVIIQRFGVSGPVQTHDEVAEDFGVTRERIRQIEAKALRKLRHSSRSQHLKDYLEREHDPLSYIIDIEVTQ